MITFHMRHIIAAAAAVTPLLSPLPPLLIMMLCATLAMSIERCLFTPLVEPPSFDIFRDDCRFH